MADWASAFTLFGGCHVLPVRAYGPYPIFARYSGDVLRCAHRPNSADSDEAQRSSQDSG